VVHGASRQVGKFGEDLPDLESICILADWPEYYEGNKYRKSASFVGWSTDTLVTLNGMRCFALFDRLDSYYRL
jgi:hypothetical protein